MHLEKYIKRMKPKEENSNFWLKSERENLGKMLEEMKSRGLSRISSISGVDTGKNIEVLYHFIHKKFTVNIRVPVSKKNPEIETITPLFPGANLFERELSEMLGITVKNHPNPKNLFLDENSPKAPYRKS